MLIDTTILDALPDAYLLVQGGSIRWASRGASHLLDAPADALRCRRLRDVLAPGETERLDTLDQQRREGWNLPETCRIRFIRVSDSSPIDADVRTGTLPEGEVPTVIYCARDLTEIRRAEELIGKLADVGANPQAMLGADAMLDAAEPIFGALGWTAAFAEILEDGSITRRVLSPEGDPVGAYGRSLIGHVMPFDRTPILTEVVQTRKAVFLPNVPTLLDGLRKTAVPLGESMTRARLTRSAWCPVIRDGRVTHLLAVGGKDMTERDMVALRLFAAQIGAAVRMRELHDALLQRGRLAAIGEMAAVMAHEIRNPLGVIFNAVGRLRRVVHGPADAEGLLEVAWEEAERLKRLVADLLEFARPYEPSLGPADLAPIVEEAVAAVQRDPALSHARTASLDVGVAEGLPPVQADPARLHRALVNLLTNAFQHVPPEGRVSVSAERAGDAEVRLSIYNDGSPIAPEIAPRIFDPFFTTRAAGTGLGLAVVRRIVEDLGGRIGLDAKETGVSFSVWLRSSQQAE